MLGFGGLLGCFHRRSLNEALGVDGAGVSQRAEERADDHASTPGVRLEDVLPTLKTGTRAGSLFLEQREVNFCNPPWKGPRAVGAAAVGDASAQQQWWWFALALTAVADTPPSGFFWTPRSFRSSVASASAVLALALEYPPTTSATLRLPRSVAEREITESSRKARGLRSWRRSASKAKRA